MIRNFKSSILLSFLFIQPIFSFPVNIAYLIKNSPKESIDQVWQIIYRDYLDTNGKYDQKDWLELRKKVLSNKYQDQNEAYETIRSMLASLDDPYTRFLEPKDFNEMKIETIGELTGIGIQISIDEESKKLIVVSPIEGTPAYYKGLKANDIIINIDGNSTHGISIDRAVKLIRGKKGTKVTLGIMRGNKQFKVTLVRERIEIRTVTSRLNVSPDGVKIGYIRLKQFSAYASKEMRSSISDLEFKGIDAYVLDLRGNPGGLLESSIEIARQFLNQGIIVSTKSKDGITDIRRANGTALTSKPLAILVNEGSASASEILSGAVRDNKRGILVGRKTFGKGLVQSVRTLDDGSGLTVTVAKYLTPNGIDINKYGIKPDIDTPLKLFNNKPLTMIDLGTRNDSQYLIAVSELERLLSRKNTNNYTPFKSNLNEALSN